MGYWQGEEMKIQRNENYTKKKYNEKHDNTMLLLLDGQLGHYLLASRKKFLTRRRDKGFKLQICRRE